MSSKSEAVARLLTKATETFPPVVHLTVTEGQCKMAPTPGEDVNCELTVTDECMVRPDAGHSKA